MEASRGVRADGRHGGLDSKTFSWKLRAIVLAPAPTYVPLRLPGTKRPGGAWDPSGPSAACARLGRSGVGAGWTQAQPRDPSVRAISALEGSCAGFRTLRAASLPVAGSCWTLRTPS